MPARFGPFLVQLQIAERSQPEEKLLVTSVDFSSGRPRVSGPSGLSSFHRAEADAQEIIEELRRERPELLDSRIDAGDHYSLTSSVKEAWAQLLYDLGTLESTLDESDRAIEYVSVQKVDDRAEVAVQDATRMGALRVRLDEEMPSGIPVEILMAFQGRSSAMSLTLRDSRQSE